MIPISYFLYFILLQVDVTPVSHENHHQSPLHLLKLDIREPRLRRVRGGRVLVNHPVNEEFEEQLSKPFYFRQHEHGTVVDVLFPKGESAEVLALKKGKLSFRCKCRFRPQKLKMYSLTFRERPTLMSSHGGSALPGGVLLQEVVTPKG